MSDAIPGYWYDGHSAVRHGGVVRLGAEGDTLELLDDGGTVEPVPLVDLAWREARPDNVVYGRVSVPDFRLTLPADLPAPLAKALPGRAEYGRWIDRLGLGKAVVFFAAVSAGAVALVFTAPDWLGPRVPESWERRMGEAMVGDFGNRLCSTPQSDRAMAKLARALDPGARPVQVGIVNVGVVNAAAIPGQRVLVFDGLLAQTESQDEFAAVLAHEIGHVRERHVMTAMMRQFGISILASGMGGNLPEGAFGIASLSYSREAEREADAFARQRLAAANISPIGAAHFFERLHKQEGGARDYAMVGWLASHPESAERAKAFRTARLAGHRYRDILTPKEFDDLTHACVRDPDVEEFDFF